MLWTLKVLDDLKTKGTLLPNGTIDYRFGPEQRSGRLFISVDKGIPSVELSVQRKDDGAYHTLPETVVSAEINDGAFKQNLFSRDINAVVKLLKKATFTKVVAAGEDKSGEYNAVEFFALGDSLARDKFVSQFVNNLGSNDAAFKRDTPNAWSTSVSRVYVEISGPPFMVHMKKRVSEPGNSTRTTELMSSAEVEAGPLLGPALEAMVAYGPYTRPGAKERQRVAEVLSTMTSNDGVVAFRQTLARLHRQEPAVPSYKFSDVAVMRH